MWIMVQLDAFHGSWPHRTNHNPHPPVAQTIEVAYEERVTPRRWQLAAETCRGNLMSIVKAYNTIELCWFSCTGTSIFAISELFIINSVFRVLPTADELHASFGFNAYLYDTDQV
jgi:hypothetical protein